MTAFLTWEQGCLRTRTKHYVDQGNIASKTWRRPVEFVTGCGLTVWWLTFQLSRIWGIAIIMGIWNRFIRTLPVTFLFAFCHDLYGSKTRNAKTQHWTSNYKRFCFGVNTKNVIRRKMWKQEIRRACRTLQKSMCIIFLFYNDRD